MEDESKQDLKEKTETSHFGHLCNISTNACIQTIILKQHIKSVHRKNENKPCQFCKDTFIVSCLKLTKIVKREKVEENCGANNSEVNSSNSPLKTESNSTNCKSNDFAFESEFSNDSLDTKDEKKMDIINEDERNLQMNTRSIILPILKWMISKAVMRYEESEKEDKLKCEICAISFKNQYNLKMHLKSIHGEKYHNQCAFCKRQFSKKSIFEHTKMCSLGPPRKCKICGKVFQSKSQLDNHNIVQHEIDQDQIGKCQKCNKTYKRTSDLAVHKRRHHNEGSEECIFKCDICEATFLKRESLKTHKKRGRHQKPKNHHCEQCSVSFENVMLLKIHNSLTHSLGLTKLAKCEICNKELLNEQSLTIHKIKKHPELAPKEICYLCQKELKTKGALQKHIIQDHNGYKCLKCNKVFKIEYIYQSHVKKYHEGAIGQKCDFCDYTAFNLWYLRTHVKDQHTEKKLFQCSDCNQSFNRKNNLTSHIKSVHQKIKDKECPHCEATFSRTSNLKTHVISLHGTKENLVCEQCGKHFVRLDTLKEHIVGVHEGKVNLLCEICGKAFHRKSRLDLHLYRKHKPGSKLYNFCGKSFSEAKNLSMHLKGVHKVEESEQTTTNGNTHEDFPIRETKVISSNEIITNKRPWIFKCEFCLEVFEGKHKHNNHILTVHPDKHKCPLCGKSFGDKFYLSTHLKAHQNRDCQTCKMSFLTSGYLKSHVAEFHNEEVDKETSKF